MAAYHPGYRPEDLLALWTFTGGVAKYVELLIEQLREIIRRDYPVFSGHALEEYFRRKFAESGQWTRIGSWWDRKGENELDMVAENELTGEYAICEVKRQGGKIDLGCVADKFAVFQRATGKWQKVTPKFVALAIADM